MAHRYSCNFQMYSLSCYQPWQDGLASCCSAVSSSKGSHFPVITFFYYELMSFWSLFSRSSAQPLTLPSRWYTYYPSALFFIPSLSLVYGKGWDTFFQYLVCSFVLGILVQIVYSATQLLFACLRCILHVRSCCGAPWCYVLGCARCGILCFCLHSLLSPNSCLCNGWGKCSCILFCRQGASCMEGNIATLALHAFYRATLSCLYKTLFSWYILLYVHFPKWTLLRAPASIFC